MNLSDNHAYSNGALGYDIYLPLRNGGTFCTWFTSNGVSSVDLGCGPYGKRRDAKNRRGEHSTAAGVAAIIEQLRSRTQ